MTIEISLKKNRTEPTRNYAHLLHMRARRLEFQTNPTRENLRYEPRRINAIKDVRNASIGTASNCAFVAYSDLRSAKDFVESFMVTLDDSANDFEPIVMKLKAVMGAGVDHETIDLLHGIAFKLGFNLDITDMELLRE